MGENADTQNPFFEDFDPISGNYIYSHIDFHSKTIISVKIELSLCLNTPYSYSVHSKKNVNDCIVGLSIMCVPHLQVNCRKHRA